MKYFALFSVESELFFFKLLNQMQVLPKFNVVFIQYIKIIQDFSLSCKM